MLVLLGSLSLLFGIEFCLFFLFAAALRVVRGALLGASVLAELPCLLRAPFPRAAVAAAAAAAAVAAARERGAVRLA